MQYIVRSGALLQFPELVSELGQDPLALLEAAGIESAVLKTPDNYLPYPALARLLNRAADACRRPDFGVLLAQRQGLHVVGALASPGRSAAERHQPSLIPLVSECGAEHFCSEWQHPFSVGALHSTSRSSVRVRGNSSIYAVALLPFICVCPVNDHFCILNFSRSRASSCEEWRMTTS